MNPPADSRTAYGLTPTQQVTLQTEVGQLLDLTSQPMDGKIDLNRFTLERYRLIVKYKTAFYTFYLPIVRRGRLSSRSPIGRSAHPTSIHHPPGVRAHHLRHGRRRLAGHGAAHLPHHGRVLPDPGARTRTEEGRGPESRLSALGLKARLTEPNPTDHGTTDRTTTWTATGTPR